jgi:mycothiol system anti-sigma-R factor
MDDCGPKCQETLKEVERLIDGELDASLQERVEHHLSDCNPCMQRVEFRRHVKVVVQSKCVGDRVPAGLSGRITDLIRRLDVSG